MTVLTFYGGVNEIGGNKILLEDGDTRLFFDFGIPFSKRSQSFEEYLNPRPGAGLLDLLEMGLLPPLRGVYRDDLVADQTLWDRFQLLPYYREITVDGILLSHAHLDHSGYISFLREGIPIYTTAMTAFVSKAIQDTRQDFEREVCYVNCRALNGGYLSARGGFRQRPFVFLDQPLLSDRAKDFWNESPGKKKSLELSKLTFPSNRIGSLPLRYFPVDHSIFGASAFAVETSSGWVAYTGDLRLHGSGARQTETFIEETARLHPQVLLCEGTRAGDTRRITEEEVYENSLRATRETKNLVIADFGPRNVERLICFHHIARELDRRLVIQAKDAHLLDAMALVSDQVPNLEKLSDILIFKKLRARSNPWEDKLLEQHAAKFISASEIKARPGDFILCFSFWDINDLIDIAPQGGSYIYSSAEAHNEEQELDMWRLRNWLRHFDMTFVGDPESEEGFHASGHASGPELLELIQRIAPKVLIPVHTQDPDYFIENLKGTAIEVHLPQEGEGFAFG